MGASILPGNSAKITLGASTLIVGCSKFTMSGTTRQTIDASEFGVDADRFVEGSANPGTISIADAIYDPANAVQTSLREAVKDKTRYTHSGIGDTDDGLRFWLDDYTFFTIEDSSDAFVMVTKSNDVVTERNGLAKCSIEMQASGGFMDQFTELTLNDATGLAEGDTSVVVDYIPSYVPQAGTLTDGTNTFTYSAWTGVTFTITAVGSGITVADDSVLRVAW